MSRDLRILTFTSLYPSASRPRHGIFVESRLQRLVRRGGAAVKVVAPVPWYPFKGDRWGEYGRIAATPRRDVRAGIEIIYPRYLMLPRVGMALQPHWMARAALREVEALLRAGEDFDVVDAQYLYPDGVAGAELAARIGRPLVLTARGSDVNVIAQLPGPRRKILRAIDSAGGLIAVSAALKTALMGLGVAADKITVLRNGVDADLFYPEDRALARNDLGMPGDAPSIASVGNLIPGKRHDLAIEAAAAIDGLHVMIVGRGPERARLERIAQSCGIAGRVRFFDEMPQSRLRFVYSAADALVLASEREGWPNVVLESAACGTPVVAFNIGGVPEILADPTIGTVARGDHCAAPLTAAIQGLLVTPPSRGAVRAAAVRFSWDPVLEAQLALYRRVVRQSAADTSQASAEVARA